MVEKFINKFKAFPDYSDVHEIVERCKIKYRIKLRWETKLGRENVYVELLIAHLRPPLPHSHPPHFNVGDNWLCMFHLLLCKQNPCKFVGIGRVRAVAIYKEMYSTFVKEQ